MGALSMRVLLVVAVLALEIVHGLVVAEGAGSPGGDAPVDAQVFRYQEEDGGGGYLRTLALIGVVALIPAAYLVMRYFGRKGREIAEMYRERRIDAPERDVVAEAKSMFLEGRERDAFRLAYRELRRILGGRYGGNLTLRECLERLEADPEVDGEVKRSVRESARMCEAVGFGRHSPSQEELYVMLRGLSLARRLGKEGDAQGSGAQVR